MSQYGPLGDRQLSIVQKVSDMWMKLKSELPIDSLMADLSQRHPDYWYSRESFMDDIRQLHIRGYIFCEKQAVVPTHKALIQLGYESFPKLI